MFWKEFFFFLARKWPLSSFIIWFCPFYFFFLWNSSLTESNRGERKKKQSYKKAKTNQTTTKIQNLETLITNNKKNEKNQKKYDRILNESFIKRIEKKKVKMISKKNFGYWSSILQYNWMKQMNILNLQ